ncbi:MAG TPA: hypothetical protein DCE41_27845 [Cytophagales bacterium]|nr:hypothetical protein [Cytophagales bacterium]HAA19741.1 hypothetical protein [Cytophagales bacterium]HAP63835.1 hypothetical protein [Cytophagales bacterium]
MKQFLMLFRSETFDEAGWSEAEVGAHMQRWDEYIQQLAEKGAFQSGEALYDEGQVVEGDQITDGPFAEGKELVGGYVIVKAESAAVAAELAKPCPVHEMEGGTVEIREIRAM